jgi:hypothetical protein
LARHTSGQRVSPDRNLEFIDPIESEQEYGDHEDDEKTGAKRSGSLKKLFHG